MKYGFHIKAVIALSACFFSSPTKAWADVFGRIEIKVVNVDDEKPIPGATVELLDSRGQRSTITLKTNSEGSVLSPPLENRKWSLKVQAKSFAAQSKSFDVSSDAVQTLQIRLEPAETTIVVREERQLLKKSSTAQSVKRDAQFFERFPVATQNPQQLTGLFASAPGFVPNSANQVHPRGEHSATSIFIQGLQLGGANQGRFGPILDSRVLETVEILTGSFAPEYGSQSAAILNTSIRSGGKIEERKFEVGAGNYNSKTFFASAGGQAGRARDGEESLDNPEKVFAYYLAASGRSTDNALEAPQPRNQTAHNSGESATFLAKLDVKPTQDDEITIIANAAPARTDIANRSGLPERYSDFGQGYGYGGALSLNQANSLGIGSQEDVGQDIYQDDFNAFGVLQWRHDFSSKTSSMFSIGTNQSNLDVKNDNPAGSFPLPADGAIEFDPRVKRHANHILSSGSLTTELEKHTLKGGFFMDFQRSDDSYRLTPRSQLALDALQETDPRFVPTEEQLRTGNSPTVNADSRGYYHAAYVQDTWRITDDLSANFGLRYDTYHQDQDGREMALNKDQFSPRMNLSYSPLEKTVLRASYNRLFIDPPLSQGSVIGEPISPERVNQYDVSIEQQLGTRQKLKASYYYKDIQNQIDTGLLIPSTQLGVFTSVNLDRAHIQGVELSYDLLPEGDHGVSAFANYSYSVARPFGSNNLGEEVEQYNDHDQRDTVNGGLAYTFAGGESLGITQFWGSGIFSSPLEEGGPRQSRSQTNLVASTDPKLLFNRAGLRLDIQNLFDERARLNFNSAFSGTRFQQGRTILLSTFFSF